MTSVLKYALLLLFLSLILRAPSLHYTFLDVDESQFAGFAHTLLDGGLPYRDSLDTKPPLIYLFFAAIFSVFGKYNMAAVHAVTILWSWLTALVLWKIGSSLNRERAGRWAALFFVVFSTTYLPKFISTSITAVMALPLALSVLFWVQSERKFFKFLSGIMTALAFLLKYQGGIQLVVFFVWGWLEVFRKKQTFRRGAADYLIYLAGFFIPVALTILWLNHLGVWSDFVEWSFKGSKHYLAAGNATIPFFKNLVLRGGLFVLSTLLLWVLVIRAFRKEAVFGLIPVWFLLSLVPVMTGGRFYGHYFIQMLPPLCLLAGFGMDGVDLKRWTKWTAAGLAVPAIVFLALRVDFERTDRLFPDDSLFEQQRIGTWIKNHSEPQETLLVWGYATAIYFHAERKATSRFLWMDLLTGKVPGSQKANDPAFDTSAFVRPEAWAAFWEDMKKNPPTYFVDTSPCNIHNYAKYPITAYSDLVRFVGENYHPWQMIERCTIYKKN